MSASEKELEAIIARMKELSAAMRLLADMRWQPPQYRSTAAGKTIH